MLAPRGTCVSIGVSAGTESSFDVRSFYLTGGAILYGFIIFYEVLAHPASEACPSLAPGCRGDFAAAHRAGGAVGRDWGYRRAPCRSGLRRQGGAPCRMS